MVLKCFAEAKDKSELEDILSKLQFCNAVANVAGLTVYVKYSSDDSSHINRIIQIFERCKKHDIIYGQ